MNFIINLNDFGNVKSFHETVCKFDSDIDAYSGRYIVDAKSILGLYTLDLSKNIDIKIHTEDEGTVRKFKNAIIEYIV